MRQLTGGFQSGAYELTGGVVLKWTAKPSWAPRVRRAAELVRRARAVGYPTPEWLYVGTTAAGSPYQLQAFVPGTPVRDYSLVDAALARKLIAICELQRDLVPEDGTSWSGWSRGVVLEGWDGVWERVSGYDEETVELLRRYGELCRPYRDQPLPEDDFVHGDLNLGNLILGDRQVNGIIDVEAAGSGSRAYDLISLATSAARDGAAPGVDELFVEAALRAGGLATVALCAGAAFVSIAEFAHDRAPHSLALINPGARRVLELLEGLSW
ncbi:MAG TPA: phosphotransferase [Kribbella sp.]